MKFCSASLAVFSIAVGIACGGAPAPKVVDSPERDGPTLAMLELGREASTATVAELTSKLVAEEPRERRDAAYALGIAANMGANVTALEAKLIALATKELDSQALAAKLWALGRIGKAPSLSTLSSALASTDSAVVAAAGLALGVLGRRDVALDGGARAALVKAATSDNSEVRYAVTYALAREYEPPVDPAVLRTLESLALDQEAEIRAAALTGLGRRERGVDRLASALADSDWRVAVEAVRGLEKIKGPRVLEAVEQWIRRGVTGKSLAPHPSRVALEGLASLADEPAAQRIAGLVLTRFSGAANLSLDEAQMVCLARAIWQRGGNEAAPLRSCGGDVVPGWWRSQLVAATLAKSAKIARPDRAQGLIELAGSKDARIRAAAVMAVADLSGGAKRAEVLALFARALTDTSAAVAGTAADQLGALALDETEAEPLHQALVGRAQRELASDGELGLTLVASIAKNRVASGLAACQLAAGHRNRTIRTAGSDCLDALGSAKVDAPAVVREPAPTPGAVVWWRIRTSRGEIVVELDPGTAPRHVAAVIKLTGDKLYDGLNFHRVVPDFVIQGGDPDGTGWGGPDFVIPAEPSPLPFDRGAVGIADAGPDTGGSQWFVMHSRAPHLEGRYTRIGTVIVGMDVVDAITVGDRIESAVIERERPTTAASSR